jgi:YtkA-like
MKIGQWVGTAVVAGGLVALSTLSTVASSAQRDVRATVDRNLSIRLKQPIVVTTGDNPFEVLIEGPDGKTINDVEVAVSFVMAAWPIKRIPETRTNLTLRLTGDGKYTATWNVSQSGPWQTTITVKRDGVRIGRKSFVLTAY